MCEGAIAFYLVEVCTLKKTERADLLRSSLEKSGNHLTKSEHIYTLSKKELSLPSGQIHRILLLRMLEENNSKNYGHQVTCDVTRESIMMMQQMAGE
jgi:hypothetical protein